MFFWGVGVLWSVFCAGKWCSVRAECSVAMICAGKGYLFQRRKEKCSRLRGILWLNPRGMLGGNVLRGILWLNPRGMFGGNVLRGKWGIFMDGIAGTVAVIAAARVAVVVVAGCVFIPSLQLLR